MLECGLERAAQGDQVEHVAATYWNTPAALLRMSTKVTGKVDPAN